MELNEKSDQEAPHVVDAEVASDAVDTKHEAHQHARPRLLWGIAAVLVVGVSFLVWSKWGEEIKEACFGEDGTCAVELEDIPEGGMTFEGPEEGEFVVPADGATSL